MAAKNWTDDELIKLVWDWRITNGACTLGDLRKATGMSKSQLGVRVNALVESGRLLASATVGSIRAASEVLMEDLGDGRLVERTAKRRPRSRL